MVSVVKRFYKYICVGVSVLVLAIISIALFSEPAVINVKLINTKTGQAISLKIPPIYIISRTVKPEMSYIIIESDIFSLNSYTRQKLSEDRKDSYLYLKIASIAHKGIDGAWDSIKDDYEFIEKNKEFSLYSRKMGKNYRPALRRYAYRFVENGRLSLLITCGNKEPRCDWFMMSKKGLYLRAIVSRSFNQNRPFVFSRIEDLLKKFELEIIK